MAGEIDRAHVRLAELVAALSLGIDLGFGQPMEHVLRQCLISLRLAEAIGLDEEQRSVVYYTALLLNVGCHSDAHEQAKWFGDDIELKSTKYDHELRSVRAAVSGLRSLGAGNPPLHRFRLGLEFALSGHREVDHMVEHHGAIARSLAEQLDLPEAVLDALGAGYERWDGKGWPGDLERDGVPIASRVAGMAEFIEVANRLGGVEAAKELARERRGRQFDPALSGLVEREGEVILSGLEDIATWDAVIEAEPALAVVLSGERVDAALLAIANFVDLKSPYFLGHAHAVAQLAAEAGARLGMNDAEVRLLRRAGLVHDLGRLGVSNAIWDKRGPLGAGRVGARPFAAVPHRAHAEAVGGARADGGDRRPAPRAARRLGLPAGALGRRDLPLGSCARCRRRLPGDARAASAPRSARAGRRPRLSCAPT